MIKFLLHKKRDRNAENLNISNHMEKFLHVVTDRTIKEQKTPDKRHQTSI